MCATLKLRISPTCPNLSYQLSLGLVTNQFQLNFEVANQSSVLESRDKPETDQK